VYLQVAEEQRVLVARQHDLDVVDRAAVRPWRRHLIGSPLRGKLKLQGTHAIN
jgi:hypothetical protein